MNVYVPLPNSSYTSTTYIKEYLFNVVHRLKIRNIWQYLEPPVRGWLDLACKLKGIKFKSRKVLLVLCNILSRVKNLLSFPGLVASIGVRAAWRASTLAASWGNKDAEKWRNDKAFNFYCGLVSLQVSKMIPRTIFPELHFLQEVVQLKFIEKILRFFRKML